MPTEDGVLNVGDVVEGGALAEGETFPRSYVEELRAENAKYRTRAKAYDDVFGQYDDEDREVLINLARDLYENPEQGAKHMRALADGLLEQYGSVEAAAEAVEVGAAVDKDPRFVTWEDLQEYQNQVALDNEIASIEREARSMGYNPESVDYVELLWTAQHQTGGDLTKAHESLAERRQSWYDSQRQGEQTDFPAAPVAADGFSPSTGRELKTWDDAKAALEARIAAAEASR